MRGHTHEVCYIPKCPHCSKDCMTVVVPERLAQLEKENKELRVEIEMLNSEHKHLYEINCDLAQLLGSYRQALEFYANPKTWEWRSGPMDGMTDTDAKDDQGTIAKQALGESEDE